ncbi:MAG: type II toxin-antitoxin system VapC family toxin [Candidatus Binatia bacterium]
MRLYLDTAPVIYTVERVSPYFAAVNARVSVVGVVLITSDLTRMECRIKPLRQGDTTLLKDYDDYFREAVTATVSLSSEIMERAAEVRAKYGFKTPDAIHLGAAVVSGCEVFLTNDHRLDRFAELSVEVVQR